MEPVVVIILPSNAQHNLATSDLPTSLPGGHSMETKGRAPPDTQRGTGLEELSALPSVPPSRRAEDRTPRTNVQSRQ